MSANACPACGADLETPLVCTSCGALCDPPAEGSFERLSPFALFGLPERYELDPGELKRRLLRFGRRLHPDYFAAQGGEARQRAERATAALNGAHKTLADDARRADALIRSLGGPSDAEQREMPKPFLLEVLEWNEALEEARASAPGSPARAALPGLADELRARRGACLASVRDALAREATLEALREARSQLNAVRYLDRALRELEELRLQEPAPR